MIYYVDIKFDNTSYRPTYKEVTDASENAASAFSADEGEVDWLNNRPGRKFDLHDHATSQLKFQTSPLNLLLKHGRLTSVTLRSAI